MKTTTSLKRGFTLVEIMIVVAIIGLLAAVAIPNLVEARKQGQITGCKTNLTNIRGAIAMFALRENKTEDHEVTIDDLVKYMARKPKCPAGGTYEVTTVDEDPTCSINGHTLNEDEEEEEERPPPHSWLLGKWTRSGTSPTERESEWQPSEITFQEGRRVEIPDRDYKEWSVNKDKIIIIVGRSLDPLYFNIIREDRLEPVSKGSDVDFWYTKY